MCKEKKKRNEKINTYLLTYTKRKTGRINQRLMSLVISWGVMVEKTGKRAEVCGVGSGMREGYSSDGIFW